MSNDPTVLTFDMESDAYPLNEKIMLRSDIAAFESQLASISTSSPDFVFLSSISFGNCAYGACDCAVYPFVCAPKRPFTSLPTAAEILSELKITNFQSEHIVKLDTAQIPYPGNHAGTKNDEIHTDPSEQHMFAYEIIDDEDEDEKLSRASHAALRNYVINRHLFYILIHDKPQKYGDYMLSNFVLLFAIGVSPATGNLVGAVSHQACHNLCD